MEVSIASRLGQIIRARRREKGLSQEELADRAGLHRTYVGLLERGKRSATLETLQKLATALSTSMTKLVSELERLEGGE